MVVATLATAALNPLNVRALLGVVLGSGSTPSDPGLTARCLGAKANMTSDPPVLAACVLLIAFAAAFPRATLLVVAAYADALAHLVTVSAVVVARLVIATNASLAANAHFVAARIARPCAMPIRAVLVELMYRAAHATLPMPVAACLNLLVASSVATRRSQRAQKRQAEKKSQVLHCAGNGGGGGGER